MLKEIYHTTRLGIQTGFGVIGIAISFCRRSFYYLDFFRLGYFIYICCIFWGGVLFLVNLFTVFYTNVVGIRFVERLDQRDPATQNHRAHGGNFHVFFQPPSWRNHLVAYSCAAALGGARYCTIHGS
ncbi:hypothetical protein V8C40DRAFT_237418 [Trichoderma camerunense]